MAVSALTLDDVREYFARVKWTFARTMPTCPHTYTVRDHEPDLEHTFDTVVQLIRREGILRYWPTTGSRKEVKPSLDLDGFEYWTVGDPIGICRIINRAVLPPDPHPGAIPDDELDHAQWMDAQRGRRVRLIKHGPGAQRRRGRGQRPSNSIDELPPGTEGTVMCLDTLEQVHVRWDDLSRTALKPGRDDWTWL